MNVDADVVIPETDKIATAKVKKQTFSQETADKLMQLLLEGQTLYDYYAYTKETKGDVMEKLMKLYAMRDGAIPVEVDGGLEETIALYEKEYEEAPEERTLTPAQTAFHQRDAKYMPYDCIEGIAEIGGASAYFYIQNDTEENCIYAQFNRDVNNQYAYSAVSAFIGMFKVDETKLTMDITAEEAQTQTDAFMEALGLSSNMVCGSIEPGIKLADGLVLAEGDEIDYDTTGTAWIVRYVRTVNGVPVTYTGDTGGQIEDEEATRSRGIMKPCIS